MVISSPIAKYSSSGQLTCVICNGPVKSEKLWTAHLAGREHKKNVAALKSKQSQGAKVAAVPPSPSTSTKRPAPSVENGDSSLPSKKAKSLSNDLPADFFDASTPSTSAPPHTVTTVANNHTDVSSSSVSKDKDVPTETPDGEEMPWSREQRNRHEAQIPKAPLPNTAEALPEGFFDDKLVDAKIRNVEPKEELLDEEYAKFQKEMKILDQKANEEGEEEEELAYVEREIEEIDHQIDEWGRVNELQQRKQDMCTVEERPPSPHTLHSASHPATDGSGDVRMDEGTTDGLPPHGGAVVVEEEEEEVDFERLLDWRSKIL